MIENKSKLLKEHQRFGAEIFNLVLALFIKKIFFKQIYLIVLGDALFNAATQFLDGVGERRIFFYFLFMLIRVLRLCRIDPLRPL